MRQAVRSGYLGDHLHGSDVAETVPCLCSWVWLDIDRPHCAWKWILNRASFLYVLFMSAFSDTNDAGPPVRKYNQRMAQRVARRANVNEQGAAVCFAFNNLLTSVLIGVVEDVARYIPTVGALLDMAISIITFYFHRIVLVTDQNVYVYRDWPFHFPGKQLAAYPRHAGLVKLGSPNPGGFSRFIRRGQLTFEDGHVVYHGILWIRRAQYIVQVGNSPAQM